MEARLTEKRGQTTFSGLRLQHPIFDSVRQCANRLEDFSLDALNLLADKEQIRTEAGQRVRFVPPAKSDPYYEIHLFETGQVQTRPENRHDLFNALVWLSFPKTKARINAMHAAEIPREGGKRGRLRDMLTIFDEGGAIVTGGPSIESLVRGMRWPELFLHHHEEFRITVLGHAVMEQALDPHPGITCKVIFADPTRNLDEQASDWLATQGKSPKDLAALPVFGYPGWFPGSGTTEFYRNTRYFRPLKNVVCP